MDSPRFTVVTPTYNSIRVLHRVFESLVAQTCRDFEWLVIDDASTDDTRQLIASMLHRANFPMRVILKPENRGLFDSYNIGMTEGRGRFFVGAGHDDRFDPDSLQFFKEAWDAIPENTRLRYCGITVRCRDVEGRTAEEFPADGMDSNFLDMYYRYKCRTEQWTIYRMDVLREFPFPAQYKAGGEGALIWFPMAERYLSRFFNRPLRIYYRDNPGSITANTDPKRFAAGMTAANRNLLHFALTHPDGTFQDALFCAARFLRFAFYSPLGVIAALRELENKSMPYAIIAAPLAIAMIVWDFARHRASRSRTHAPAA